MPRNDIEPLYRIDPERRALYGFDFADEPYRGWFDKLFQEYTLHPYLDLRRQETQDLLYKKTRSWLLFSKLAPIFSKQLRVTSLLNKILGINLFKNQSESDGWIKQLADVLVTEVEARRTLDIRLSELEEQAKADHRYFCGLDYQIYGRTAPPLIERPHTTDGLIVIEGILNNLQAIKTVNAAAARGFEDTDIEWVLSDFPYFDLDPAKNPNFEGGTLLGIKLDATLRTLLCSIPFDSTLGWYPYVTIFGVFHNVLSAGHPQIKALDWCWMKFRQPNPFGRLPRDLDGLLEQSRSDKAEYADKKAWKELTAYRPWLDLDRERDVLLFLNAIHVVNRAADLDWNLIDNHTKELIKLATTKYAAPLPDRLTEYFHIK